MSKFLVDSLNWSVAAALGHKTNLLRYAVIEDDGYKLSVYSTIPRPIPLASIQSSRLRSNWMSRVHRIKFFTPTLLFLGENFEYCLVLYDGLNFTIWLPNSGNLTNIPLQVKESILDLRVVTFCWTDMMERRNFKNVLVVITNDGYIYNLPLGLDNELGEEKACLRIKVPLDKVSSGHFCRFTSDKVVLVIFNELQVVFVELSPEGNPSIIGQATLPPETVDSIIFPLASSSNPASLTIVTIELDCWKVLEYSFTDEKLKPLSTWTCPDGFIKAFPFDTNNNGAWGIGLVCQTKIFGFDTFRGKQLFITDVDFKENSTTLLDQHLELSFRLNLLTTKGLVVIQSLILSEPFLISPLTSHQALWSRNSRIESMPVMFDFLLAFDIMQPFPIDIASISLESIFFCELLKLLSPPPPTPTKLIVDLPITSWQTLRLLFEMINESSAPLLIRQLVVSYLVLAGQSLRLYTFALHYVIQNSIISEAELYFQLDKRKDDDLVLKFLLSGRLNGQQLQSLVFQRFRIPLAVISSNWSDDVKVKNFVEYGLLSDAFNLISKSLECKKESLYSIILPIVSQDKFSTRVFHNFAHDTGDLLHIYNSAICLGDKVIEVVLDLFLNNQLYTKAAELVNFFQEKDQSLKKTLIEWILKNDPIKYSPVGGCIDRKKFSGPNNSLPFYRSNVNFKDSLRISHRRGNFPQRFPSPQYLSSLRIVGTKSPIAKHCPKSPSRLARQVQLSESSLQDTPSRSLSNMATAPTVEGKSVSPHPHDHHSQLSPSSPSASLGDTFTLGREIQSEVNYGISITPKRSFNTPTKNELSPLLRRSPRRPKLLLTDDGAELDGSDKFLLKETKALKEPTFKANGARTYTENKASSSSSSPLSSNSSKKVQLEDSRKKSVSSTESSNVNTKVKTSPKKGTTVKGKKSLKKVSKSPSTTTPSITSLTSVKSKSSGGASPNPFPPTTSKGKINTFPPTVHKKSTEKKKSSKLDTVVPKGKVQNNSGQKLLSVATTTSSLVGGKRTLKAQSKSKKKVATKTGKLDDNLNVPPAKTKVKKGLVENSPLQRSSPRRKPKLLDQSNLKSAGDDSEFPTSTPVKKRKGDPYKVSSESLGKESGSSTANPKNDSKGSTPKKSELGILVGMKTKKKALAKTGSTLKGNTRKESKPKQGLKQAVAVKTLTKKSK